MPSENGGLSGLPGFPAMPSAAVALGGLVGGQVGGAAGRGDSPVEAFRAGLELARACGFRAVMLDATMPGLRPRELDRSARRDVAATLRRAELGCAGLDLFIPAWHYASPEHADRAVEALLAAIDLAADLATLANSGVVTRSSAGSVADGGVGAPVVSVTLPGGPGGSAADVRTLIETRADSRRVRIADFTAGEEAVSAYAGAEAADGSPATQREPAGADSPIGLGLDVYVAWARVSAMAGGGMAGSGKAKASAGGIITGTALFGGGEGGMGNGSPGDRLSGLVARLGSRVVGVRVTASSSPRAPMDAATVESVRLALATSARERTPARVTVDTRGVAEPATVARAERERWG